MMPFPPTTFYERIEEYIEDPYIRKAPYRILAFRSTQKGRKDLVGAYAPK